MRRLTFASSEILRVRRILPIAVAGAILVLAPLAATGQSQPPSPPGQAPSATAPGQAPISDQKLGQAAAAMQKVSSVRQTYQQQLASASESDKPRITGEANQALAKAVTDQGLSVDEYYNGIMRAAQTDTSVRAGLIQHLNLNNGQPAQPGSNGSK